MSRIFDILSRPVIYELVTTILAPGADKNVSRRIADFVAKLPVGEPLLDVGCGPRSWLDRVGILPVGLDVDPAYVAAYRARGGVAHEGSADALPFSEGEFAGVWCIGVLHHIPDAMATKAISEMYRVCRPGGYVAIMDAVLPRSPLSRPLAYSIRRLDRGGHMRHETELRDLFPSPETWRFQRFTYAMTGLEMVFATIVKGKL